MNRVHFMVDPREGDTASLSLDQMVLAGRLDGARLRTVLALVGGDHQPNFLTGTGVFERSICHAVPVKIDFLALGALDEAVSLAVHIGNSLPNAESGQTKGAGSDVRPDGDIGRCFANGFPAFSP
jgi:hypothetical protein